MTECQRCGAKAQLFLCVKCEAQIQDLLNELPWWLDRLTEAAVGQTRMGDNAGRKSARRRDLDGEAELASCIELLPNEDDLDKARKAREKAALAHALAAGGVNAKASELLGEIADSLRYWIKVLCDARGCTYIRHTSPRAFSLGSSEAMWMAANIGAIAASEDAIDIATDIETHHDDIVRVVNRPVRVVYLGRCPTWIDRDNRACGVSLRTPDDSIEVYCPRCRRTHNCHRLLLERMDEAERTQLTFEQVLRVNLDQPPDWQISPRTLRHWRASGMLRAQAHDADGVALYAWGDVKRLQLRKPQKAMTGAAARKSDSTG
jgi:hypothetical protein